MRTALIENGTVTNIAVGGHGIPCPDDVGIGYAYDHVTGEFTAPETDPKTAIRSQIAALEMKADSPRARREALLGNTSYLASLDAQIAALRAQL